MNKNENINICPNCKCKTELRKVCMDRENKYMCFCDECGFVRLIDE
jgi:uncharacterized Zn finger protein